MELVRLNSNEAKFTHWININSEKDTLINRIYDKSIQLIQID